MNNSANSANYLAVRGDGNVGIGTNAPVSWMELRKSSSSFFDSGTWTGSTTTPVHALTITNSQISDGLGAWDATLLFRQTTTGGTILTSGAINMISTGSWDATTSNRISQMQFIIRNNSGVLTEMMRIPSTGIVNITNGLTTPSNIYAGSLSVGASTNTSTLNSNASAAFKTTQTASNLTLTSAHHRVLVNTTSAAVTITLPTAVGITDREYTIKDWKGTSATNNITIVTTSSQLIDGATSVVISNMYDWVTLISDGVGWTIIG